MDEVNDLLESYEFREILRKKETAIFNNVLSTQIAERIAVLFDKGRKVKVTPLSEYFPELFGESEEERIKKEREAVEAYKSQFSSFAAQLNKQRKE